MAGSSGTILLLFVFINECIVNGFALHASTPIFKHGTPLLDRIKYHETIKLLHNQFHHIDTGTMPVYPMNGKVEFNAFGRYYRLLIRQNLELFGDNFIVESHRYNKITQKMERETISTEIPKCHYTAELIHNFCYLINMHRHNAFLYDILYIEWYQMNQEWQQVVDFMFVKVMDFKVGYMHLVKQL